MTPRRERFSSTAAPSAIIRSELLRANIGFVPQETFLFSQTIRGNIAFGAPWATDSEVLEAAEAAHIRREFEEFPAGLATTVGERGVTLSGGQKQRTAIARAVIRNPRILILDDALVQRRHLHRRAHPRRTAARDAGPHHYLHLPPHLHGAPRRPDRRAGWRPHRRARHARRIDRRNGYYADLFQKQLLEEELAVTH